MSNKINLYLSKQFDKAPQDVEFSISVETLVRLTVAEHFGARVTIPEESAYLELVDFSCPNLGQDLTDIEERALKTYLQDWIEEHREALLTYASD